MIRMIHDIAICKAFFGELVCDEISRNMIGTVLYTFTGTDIMERKLYDRKLSVCNVLAQQKAI